MPLPRMTNIRCSICGKRGMEQPEMERCHCDILGCPNLIERGMTKAWKEHLDSIDEIVARESGRSVNDAVAE